LAEDYQVRVPAASQFRRRTLQVAVAATAVLTVTDAETDMNILLMNIHRRIQL